MTLSELLKVTIPPKPVDMTQVAALVLSGGEGKRLFPLTSVQDCKPALTVGGKFRLIDFSLSSALKSGCTQIYVLTQFLAASLHQHLMKTYPQSVQLLACEQTPSKKEWYQGTADAIRQNLQYLLECPADYFLILSGDQVYQMDFKPIVEWTQRKDADLVIASLPVSQADAKRMGLLACNEKGKIVDFFEKPQDPRVLERFEIAPNQYLASMGIYLFKRDLLINTLQNSEGHDFGKDLIPQLIKKINCFSYRFDGYWEDIGTIASFYQANLALDSNLNLYSSGLPPAKLYNTLVNNSLIGAGSIIHAQEIANSVLGERCVIGAGSRIEASYLMGNDFYHPPHTSSSLPKELTIGRNVHISRAIIEKNTCIGDHVTLTNARQLDHFNSDGVYIRDGIIIVARGTTLPDNYKL